MSTSLKTTNSRTSRLTFPSGPKKPVRPAPTLSKHKDEAKSFRHQNDVQVSSQEVNQEKLSSYLKTLDNTKKMSGRRRSFTSLLMTRSKVMSYIQAVFSVDPSETEITFA